MLEEILWVATLPQLRSALAFYSYVLSLARANGGNISPVGGAQLINFEWFSSDPSNCTQPEAG